MIADQTITQIVWETLRFTQDEADRDGGRQQVHAGRRARDPPRGRRLGGRPRADARASRPPRRRGARHRAARGKEAVFDYFTGEIFARARPNNQRTLMLAALLPSITESDVAAISGDAEAPRVLEYLYRHHLFTDRRRTGAEPVYQFHALFREFLLAEGRRRLPRRGAARRDGPRRRAARRARRFRRRRDAVPRGAGVAGAGRPRAAHRRLPARRRPRPDAGRLGRCAADRAARLGAAAVAVSRRRAASTPTRRARRRCSAARTRASSRTATCAAC